MSHQRSVTTRAGHRFVGVDEHVVGGLMRDMQDQPAGWYRDPVRPNRHRYWSGEHWSKTVGEELRTLKEEASRNEYDESRACG